MFVSNPEFCVKIVGQWPNQWPRANGGRSLSTVEFSSCLQLGSGIRSSPFKGRAYSESSHFTQVPPVLSLPGLQASIGGLVFVPMTKLKPLDLLESERDGVG